MSVALLPARSAAQGFALLGFPTPARIAEERVLRWPDYTPDAPLVLTYSIDEGFLADSGLSRAEIEATVRSALDRWTQASNGFVRFEPSPWDAVLNTDCTPRTVFVGPSTDIWIDWAIACNGDAACINDLPLPGWGAHIDFFSLPNDTSYCMGNRSWGTYDCNLGFISYWNNGDREITSADIVLNEKWIWTTDPAKATQASALDSEKSPLGYTAQTGDGGDPTMSRKSGVCDTCVLPDPSVPTGCENLVLAIDLETVLVHEIGHALGLDHPDETIANNSLLLDPLLFEEQPTG
ncbi:MAG: matrixin family metalloprotease, partial [Planctomycetota bacterium]